jgi:hypothetical protein
MAGGCQRDPGALAFAAFACALGCGTSGQGVSDAAPRMSDDSASGADSATADSSGDVTNDDGNDGRASADATAPDAPAVGATSDGGGSICASLGWCQLTGTKLSDVCPPASKYPAIQANEGCSAVINDWSGAVADQARNRLVLWGGGHGGYYGNEVYALDLNRAAMVRENDPSNVSGYDFSNCYAPDAYADGRPVSRHTYDGIAYIAHADKMFAFSGAKAPCGYQNSDTWTLDLATVSTAPAGQASPWRLMNPTLSSGQLHGAVGAVSDYDSNTKRVLLDDGASLWGYDVDANHYTLLNDSNAAIDYHMTARVDPKRKLLLIVGSAGSAGGGVRVFDIAPASAYTMQDWTAQVTGCDPLIHAIYPGLAYDPVQDRMIGWAGGDTVYLFNADTKSCTTATYAGGPGAQNSNGTMGRFRYFEALRVFAVLSDWKQNGFTLRLTP